MSDMKARIELTIAKNTFSKAAAAILDEIATTDVLINRERWERVRRIVAEEVRISAWSSFETQELADALSALQPGDVDDQP